MPLRVPNSIDDYETLLGETLEAWPAPKRVAFAAANAERWLPVYERFSAAEEWGDTASLRRMLDAVWAHVGGRQLPLTEIARYKGQLNDCTPHMDDFDSPDALAVCMALGEALDSCKPGNNVLAATRSGLSGFEAAVPDMILEPDQQPRLWKQSAARWELKTQLRLIEKLASLPQLDDSAVKTLRRELTGKEFLGVSVLREEKSGASQGVTNQAAFEQYRRSMEIHLRSPVWEDKSGSKYTFGMMIFAQWSARYIMRQKTITGMGGTPLADVAARRNLVLRFTARDTLEKQAPDWDEDIKQVIGLCLQNPLGEADVKSLEQLHAYGPSMRALWGIAKRAGHADKEAWDSVMAWARHRPAVWETEDKRRRKGLAHAEGELGPYVVQTLLWRETGDPFFPWAVEVDGVPWRVRLNDFPDDVMYTLMINGAEAGSFHDWPGSWQRGH